MVIDVGRVKHGQRVVIDTRKKKAVVPAKAAARAIHRREVVAGRAVPTRAPTIVKEKVVPFRVGARPSEPTIIKEAEPSIILRADKDVFGRELTYLERVARGSIIDRRPSSAEMRESFGGGRVIGITDVPTGISAADVARGRYFDKSISEQLRGGVSGIFKEAPARVGETSIFLVPESFKMRTGEYTEIGARGSFREITREEKIAEKFGRQEKETTLEYGIRTVGGIGVSALTFMAITPSPIKTFTPETVSVRATDVIQKGDVSIFKGDILTEVGVGKFGEPLYAKTMVGGKATFFKDLPIIKTGKGVSITTYVKDVSVVKGVGITETGAKTAQAFKFGGLAKDLPKGYITFTEDLFKYIPEETITIYKGGYEPTAKLTLTGKGVKVSSITGKIKAVDAVSISKPFTDVTTVDITGTKITDPSKFFGADVIKGKDVSLGFTTKISDFTRTLKASDVYVADPAAHMGGIQRVWGAGLDTTVKTTLETIGATVKTTFPTTTRYLGMPIPTFITLPKTDQIIIPKTDQIIMPKEDVRQVITTIPRVSKKYRFDTITSLQPKVDTRQAIITTPVTKPVTKLRTGVLPIIKEREMVITKPKQLLKQRVDTIPFFTPITAAIPKFAVGGFVPFALPFSLALPRQKPLKPLPISRGFAYFPSLRALVTRERGKKLKWGISVRERKITPEFAARAAKVVGGRLPKRRTRKKPKRRKKKGFLDIF